jgi:formylglycine-generating enzyme required for sulfatase activity
MLAEDLIRLKQELKQILPEEGMATAIKALKGQIPSDAPKYNAILQIEARLNDANLKRIKGVLSEDQLQLQYNQLRDDLLSLIDGLKPEDFSKEAAKKSKTGSILYQIPKKMEFQKRTKCIVRLAFEEAVIIQNIELTADTSLQSVRVSEAMEVALIDPDGGASFSIQSISSPEQFLEEDDYSEWLFYVTPLATGSHPIILKVSVIELISGKERKKEIVMEEVVTIVTQPVKEEETVKPFQNAGYSFAFSSTSVLDHLPESPPPSARPSATSAAVRKYGMVLGAFTMLLVVSWAFGLFQFIYWQEVLRLDSVEDYEAFMVKFPDGKYFNLAKQHRDLKMAVDQKSDSLLVEFLVDYPGSELEEKAKSHFHQISNENLEEKVKKRKSEKEKELKNRLPKENTTKNSEDTNKDKSDNKPEKQEITQQGEKPSPDSAAQRPALVNEKLQDKRVPANAAGVPANIGEQPLKGFPAEEKIIGALNWLAASMVEIEGGKFTMGCDPSKSKCNTFNVPQREVKVSSFQLCKYEVTQILWQSIMGENPSYSEVKNCPMCPVEYVSYKEVQDFIKKLNRKTDRKYRLPSEAEWEYAARGGINGSNTIYAGSNNPDEIAWYQKNSGHRPQPVGKKKPNALGLHDMSGGVFEWCEDTWHSNFEDAPNKASAWVKRGFESNRVIRGGSWLDDPDYLRIDYRDMDVDSLRNHITGFRLAHDN